MILKEFFAFPSPWRKKQIDLSSVVKLQDRTQYRVVTKKLLQIDNPITLQANTDFYKTMYRKLWAVDLPLKIKILV